MKAVWRCINNLIGNVIAKVYSNALFCGLGTGESQIGYIIIIEDEKGGKILIIWKSRVAKRVVKITIGSGSISAV